MAEENAQAVIPIKNYILAILRYADWIDPIYRQMAQKDRDVEYLNALYLCAADHVPAEKVAEASGQKNAADALLLVRKKYLKECVMQEYQKEAELKSKECKNVKTILAQKAGQWKQKLNHRRMVAVLNELFQEPYSEEQVNYLMDCIEAGASAQEIRSIASPKLPVPVMQRLYDLQKKRGAKTHG